MLEVHDSVGSNPIGTTNFNNPGVVQLAGDVGFKLRSVWVRVPPPGPNFNGDVAQFGSRQMIQGHRSMGSSPIIPTNQ